MDQAETILAAAMETKQLSAAVSALKEKGVLSGKRIERAEIGTPGEFEAMTDDERLWTALRGLRRLILNSSGQ